jgi:hypothetical protein
MMEGYNRQSWSLIKKFIFELEPWLIMGDLHMPETSNVMLKIHHSRLSQDIRAISRPMCTFPDF